MNLIGDQLFGLGSGTTNDGPHALNGLSCLRLGGDMLIHRVEIRLARWGCPPYGTAAPGRSLNCSRISISTRLDGWPEARNWAAAPLTQAVAVEVPLTRYVSPA